MSECLQGGTLAGMSLESVYRALLKRFAILGERREGSFPFVADGAKGEWVKTDDGDWAGGYWVLLLALAYREFKNPELWAEAEACRQKLKVHWSREDMFRGLIFYLAGARVWDLTGDEACYMDGIRAAEVMRQMYDAELGIIPLGKELRVLSSRLELKGKMTAVDNVFICLHCLWWAWKETGDSGYRKIAEQQLQATRLWLIRAEGRTDQIAAWREPSREPSHKINYQSLGQEGCWSRGQAFAIGGFCLAAGYSGEQEYLVTAERLLDYYQKCSQPDLVPSFDLCEPLSRHGLFDTSSAAILAYALSLSLKLDPELFSGLRGLRDRLVEELLVNHVIPGAEAGTLRLVHGCFNFRDSCALQNELIWGSAYLIEALALMRAEGPEPHHGPGK